MSPCTQMIKDEHHETTMEKVLDFARDSFDRLLPKIHIGEVRVIT